jgi:hypothetical protein
MGSPLQEMIRENEMKLIAVVLLVWGLAYVFTGGHPLPALLVMAPLGTGLGYHNVATIRYCRPDWFKPEPVVELGRA